MRLTVGIDRHGGDRVRLTGDLLNTAIVLSRKESRKLGKALICMADLADELDKDEDI